jgi:hypothetical protein
MPLPLKECEIELPADRWLRHALISFAPMAQVKIESQTTKNCMATKKIIPADYWRIWVRGFLAIIRLS